MKRLWALASSRALTPLVLGLFLLLYVGIAFVTDEALIVLIAITKRFPLLVLLFALIPLNMACRLVNEVLSYLKSRRMTGGGAAPLQGGFYDETVEVPAPSSLQSLDERLRGLGYRTNATETGLGATRGFSLFPARLLYHAAIVALFTGILISLGTRATFRNPIVEGEPLPSPAGSGGLVERIRLEKTEGPFLGKTLTMEVAPGAPGEGKQVFGLYPPGRYAGAFVYPRYLGVRVQVRLAAPDLPKEVEQTALLNLYPPGKEGAVAIAGSPYRVFFSLLQPEDGSDPYITGRMSLRFKVVKKDEALFSGTVQPGGVSGNGPYRIAIPEARRVVLTDYIWDNGVPLIWFASLLLVGAAFIWVPIRLVYPRREMLFVRNGDQLLACSRAEGGSRKHDGIFHETLDLLDSRRL